MGQRVVMVNPDWKRGFVDKFLVCRPGSGLLAGKIYVDEVVPITNFSIDDLTHTQIAYTGDYLIRIRHSLNDDTLSENVFLINEPKLVHVSSKFTLGPKVREYIDVLKNKEIKLFSMLGGLEEMKPVFDCSMRLVKRFLAPMSQVDNEMYEFILDELKYSKDIDCPVTWGMAAKKPQWLTVRERLVTDSDGNTANHTSEHWLLIHKNGDVTMPELEPTKGAHIDLESQRTLKIYNAAPQPMPDTVYRAVKITIGVNEVDGLLRGVALKLYKS